MILHKRGRKPSRPGVGRPTRAQAELRREELLEAALDTFLERGFEQTTMEEIADTVGMSKQTLYARYDDKSALFKAAVRRAIARYTLSLETLRGADVGDLKGTLMAIARLRIANLMTPNAIKLQRILSAQSYRFPELFQASFDEGVRPAVDFLSELFARHHASGEIDVEEPARAATAFLSLTVGGPARAIVAGRRLDQSELEARTKFAVRLFLDGVRRR